MKILPLVRKIETARERTISPCLMEFFLSAQSQTLSFSESVCESELGRFSAGTDNTHSYSTEYEIWRQAVGALSDSVTKVYSLSLFTSKSCWPFVLMLIAF